MMTVSDDPLKESKDALKHATDAKNFWYDEFEVWFKTKFYYYDPVDGVFPLIRWDPIIQEWFYFNKQVYKKFPLERIHQIVFKWGGMNGEKVDPKDLNLEVKRLKAFLLIDHKKWDLGYWAEDYKNEEDDFFALHAEDFDL